MKRLFGIEVEYNRHEHSLYLRDDGILICDTCNKTLISNKNLDGWRNTEDASVIGELVSPILSPNDNWVDNIKEILSVIDDTHFSTYNCGLHVHIDARDMSREQVRNVYYAFAHWERTIESFVASHRINNRYCERIDIMENGWDIPYNRYKALNANAYREKGTLEYRLADGTFDIERIEALVNLWNKFTEYYANEYAGSSGNDAEELLATIGVDKRHWPKLIDWRKDKNLYRWDKRTTRCLRMVAVLNKMARIQNKILAEENERRMRAISEKDRRLIENILGLLGG